MAIRTYISIITLNVNGLNAPTKRHRLAEWIQKQDPYICSYCHFLNCLELILQIFLRFLDYVSPINICCKACLVVLNSLNFCFSEKLLISPSGLNKILAGYSNNLGCRFFPFSTLNISCHSFLACRVSAERSAVKHMGFPLYVTC